MGLGVGVLGEARGDPCGERRLLLGEVDGLERGLLLGELPLGSPQLPLQ